MLEVREREYEISNEIEEIRRFEELRGQNR